MSTPVRPMTAAEHAQGYAVCECGRFAHLFGARAMQRLPRDYSGALCPRCTLWMCSVELLEGREPGPGAGDAEP